MKGMKKLLSILMVLTLVLSLGAIAFAATVTIDSKLDGHTFTAYQIFTGTQNEDSDNKLAEVAWGSDIDPTAFVAALKAISAEKFAACTADDVKTVVKAISENKDLADQIAEAAYSALKKEAKGVSFTKETELNNGYYLIKDTTENLNGNDAYNDVVLQVTEDVEIQYKTNIPSSEKKVQDIDDTTGTKTDWQDSADWDIGDQVPFKLTGTLPSNYGDYTKYAITFHDEESDGLTFNESSVAVKVGDKTLTKGTDYTVVAPGSDGCTFEIVITDLKTAAPDAVAGSVVEVTYTSELNEHAKIGSEGNPNTMHMEFSNNMHGDGTGNTPDDTVIVFTFEFNANKVHPNGTNEDGSEKLEPLKGAGFTLYKKGPTGEALEGHEGTWNAVGEELKGDDMTTFEFKGLDDGEYVLVETTVPAGFNKADDVEFKIEATHDKEAAAPKLLTFKGSGGVKTDENASSDTALKGVIDLDVVNREGLELPETGGIGTTIFYIAGAVLVAGAVILLVTKKRVSGMEK